MRESRTGAIRLGFDTNQLAANDDSSVGPVSLVFTVDFFGLNFKQVYVNNNGNVTFDTYLSRFTPTDLTTQNRQILAPFWADVDTRGRGSGRVSYGPGAVNGRPAFGVNWPGVGYFVGNSDKLNTFQPSSSIARTFTPAISTLSSTMLRFNGRPAMPVTAKVAWAALQRE
jgi:hypothetical protein